jgi:hypothetical protein
MLKKPQVGDVIVFDSKSTLCCLLWHHCSVLDQQ